MASGRSNPAIVVWFTRLVTIVALALNAFIYLYPDLLNEADQCNWHEFDKKDHVRLKSTNEYINYLPEYISEKILLTFPQYIDDSSRNTKSPRDSSGSVKDINLLAFGDPQINGNWPSTKYIKRIDNYGNDYYLGHIYRTMKSRLRPSHVAVMGDLFSSQWILDSEFYNRTNRFADRLFPRPLEYKRNVVETFQKHENYNWQKWLEDENALDPLERFQSRVYNDVYDWFNESEKYPNFENPLFINLTGNHDIGYSGDATWQHMARFHYLFGQNNYVINYNKGTPEEWRLVVLDSMTLEGPALQEEFVNFTWSFLENLKERENPNFKGSTILLTHIPFYKREGLCRDGPEHIYYIDNKQEPYKNGKLRSQNHLSYEVSQKVLDIIFPNNDKSGLILTGHDHEGCDDWYNYEGHEWVASKEKNNKEREPIREIVVRSMMGDFDGQTGILTGHFNYPQNSWDFEFTYCSFTVQHWWWAAKVTLFLTILLQSILFLRR
ncbi:calcineurin-like phosphoesterase-domain-containing protein [Scheffersomyces xylosifermentans]|uniref:calcineurin-like phosphoesterase-domain-containing protein n=1 Tax=Scheffersomyces xylosifermentans TaxID=1304137 RepID=UPI00315D75B1